MPWKDDWSLDVFCISTDVCKQTGQNVFPTLLSNPKDSAICSYFCFREHCVLLVLMFVIIVCSQRQPSLVGPTPYTPDLLSAPGIVKHSIRHSRASSKDAGLVLRPAPSAMTLTAQHLLRLFWAGEGRGWNKVEKRIDCRNHWDVRKGLEKLHLVFCVSGQRSRTREAARPVGYQTTCHVEHWSWPGFILSFSLLVC